MGHRILPAAALAPPPHLQGRVPPQCEILEVGIGTGANLPYYPGHSIITGVDLSRPMLERALARARRLGRQLIAEVTDVENLRFGDGSFDTVVSTLTLCTTTDPHRLLTEMARVCRPTGRVLLLTRDIAALPGQAGLRVLDMERHVFGIFVLIEAAPR